MDTIICLFYKIPSTVYAAIAASVITLLGVSLSNRAANKRLITQLSIESNERKQERDVNLRKDVYLKTAEELTKAQQYLGSLANSDLSNLQNQQKTLGELFSATSKIHIVGSDETIRCVVNVTCKFTVAMLSITAKSMSLHDLKSDIDILSGLIDDFSSKRENYLNEITAFNLSGNADKVLWDKLQGNFNFVRDEIANYIQERSQKWDEHNVYQRQLMIECVRESLELAELVVPAVISIRKELGLPFNEIAYIELMKKQSLEAEAVIKSFLSDIDKNEHA
ncbi:hypothetical protein G3444_14185 [Shewanella baltica]|uniref:hypothetical protein n=1 Tax=Shewanella baltica TaxID=62322 RepID=UPI00217D24AE|nr:hypothetical protein [Shewanella baltica]MCS6120035.1 hypothetical protein [Shewanella baltica]